VYVGVFLMQHYIHRPRENLLRHVSEIHPVCIKSVLRTLKWMHVQLRQKKPILMHLCQQENLLEQNICLLSDKIIDVVQVYSIFYAHT
jgi:hypothetical protein